ncbi:hypothetical protein V8E51_020017 [Hyaloscypha variabilis]
MSGIPIQSNFRHPFKDRNMITNNPQIHSIFKQRSILTRLHDQIQKIPTTATTADLDTLVAWYDDARVVEDKLQQQEQEEAKELQKKREELSAKIGKSLEINDATTTSLRTARETESQRAELTEMADRKFETALAKFRSIRGDTVTRRIITAEFGTDVIPAPIQSTKTKVSHEIPAQLIETCRSSLPGGDSIGEWTVDEICRLIKDTGDHIEVMQLNLGEARQIRLPDEAISQITERVRQGSQIPLSPIKIAKGPATIIPRSNQKLTSAQNTTGGSSGTISEAGEDADLVPREKFDACESLKMDLELQLEDAMQQLASMSAEKRCLRATLLRNYQYGIQVKTTVVEDFCRALKVCLPESINDTAPYFTPRKFLYVADTFDNRPRRPKQPYGISYLYSILEDVRIDADLEIDTEIQARQAFRNTKENLPWLGIAINDILKSGSDQEIQMLLHYIEVVILNVQPCGFARATLFLIVAGLVQQCPQMRETLWLLLYTQVLAHGLGSPNSEWDLLDNLSFSWFLAVGDPASIEDIIDDPLRRSYFQRLVIRLRSNPSSNFISFLLHSAVTDFVTADDRNLDIPSTIIPISKSNGDQMVIMRTFDGTGGFHHKEYIWVKTSSGVTFLDQGIRVRLGLQDGFFLTAIQPVSLNQVPLFTIKSEDQILQDYIDQYHEEDADQARHEYCSRAGVSMPD